VEPLSERNRIVAVGAPKRGGWALRPRSCAVRSSESALPPTVARGCASRLDPKRCTGYRAAIASCRRRTEARRLALRLASGRGLSVVSWRPSVVQVQLYASPRTVPGRDFTSVRTKPKGVRTRASTSLTLPSSSMNSKFDHARHGSWSGRWLRRKSNASCSQANADGLTAVQRGDFIGLTEAPTTGSNQHIRQAHARGAKFGDSRPTFVVMCRQPEGQ
jgi:hypothetical protein